MRNVALSLGGGLAIAALSGCGGSNQDDTAVETEPTSLVAPGFQSQEVELPLVEEPDIDPNEDDAPITLADAEASVRSIANLPVDGFDPVEASRKLRQAATSMTFNIPNVQEAEKNRLETVSHHLRTISAELRSTDDQAIEKARNTLKAMSQMYLQ